VVCAAAGNLKRAEELIKAEKSRPGSTRESLARLVNAARKFTCYVENDSWYDDTPLICACRNGDVEMARLLLETGVCDAHLASGPDQFGDDFEGTYQTAHQIAWETCFREMAAHKDDKKIEFHDSDSFKRRNVTSCMVKLKLQFSEPVTPAYEAEGLDLTTRRKLWKEAVRDREKRKVFPEDLVPYWLRALEEQDYKAPGVVRRPLVEKKMVEEVVEKRRRQRDRGDWTLGGVAPPVAQRGGVGGSGKARQPGKKHDAEEFRAKPKPKPPVVRELGKKYDANDYSRFDCIDSDLSD
jgi:hypothetical protein